MYRQSYRLFIFILWAAAAAGAQQIPKVDLIYPAPNGSIFDQFCSEVTKGHVEPKEVKEAVGRLPEFQALWDKQGREYLSTVLREVGVDYPFQEVQATLTVCSVVPSMGSPLMIRVRSFLASTGEMPEPTALFPMYVFHELMHRYVSPLRNGSPLRKKYSAETVRTLNLLHMFALEKLVLVKLGQSGMLKAWEELNRTERSPAHKRAWDIVEAESYEHFIDEVKLLRK
jgi:hypothetical protein